VNEQVTNELEEIRAKLAVKEILQEKKDSEITVTTQKVSKFNSILQT